MIRITVKNNDNYADIEFPCSDNYLYAKLMEVHAENPNHTTSFVYAGNLFVWKGMQKLP